MNIVRTVAELRAAVAAARRQGAVVGFVPTMGYLHDGHLSLIDEARTSGATFVVVSIFVNPAQFGPNEDFERYPRDEARDVALLESRSTDLLFAPTVDEIYPKGGATKVIMTGVAEPLEGERRPGHFDGVATVVLKLFNMVQPDLAVFGQKDAQQCAVVARMVRDLDVAVKLIFAPTVRERDGLAMSSRNSYLDETQRRLALALHAALESGRGALDRGEATDAVETAMQSELRKYPGVELDYLRLVDRMSFRAPDAHSTELLLVGAVKVGRTRLIDNLRVSRKAVAANH